MIDSILRLGNAGRFLSSGRMWFWAAGKGVSRRSLWFYFIHLLKSSKENVYGRSICMGTVRPHGSAVFKIQPYDSRKSYIVKSDAHYSMGGEVDVLEVEQGELVFKMNSLFETAGTYTILLPAGYTTKDGKREVEITVQGRGPRQVRISIEGSTDSMEDGGCYGTR